MNIYLATIYYQPNIVDSRTFNFSLPEKSMQHSVSSRPRTSCQDIMINKAVNTCPVCVNKCHGAKNGDHIKCTQQ